MLRSARHLALLLALLTGGSHATSLPDPLYPGLGQPGLDVLHYDLALTVPRPGTPWLQVTTTATLRAEQALDTVQLDYSGPDILTVQVDGATVPYTRQAAPPKLVIHHALRPGTEARVTVTAAGTVTGIQDATLPLRLGWQSVPATSTQPGANFAFNEPDGARSFVPVNDHPADPATFTTHLTVPVGVSAVASGTRLDDRTQGATHTVTYDLTVPVPTYALAIHVGTLDEVRRPAIHTPGQTISWTDYFPTSTPADLRAPYARTGDILRTLSDWFGPYPFTSYGSVVVTPALPALETATLSTMPVRSSRERVITHELAHQWFGNAVPLGAWSDTWLNEGFATYAELLWAQAKSQDPQPLLDAWRARLTGGTRPLIATSPAHLFDDSAYARGALALHALRTQVGDAAFRAFLHTYTRTRQGHPTRTADLLDLARTQLGLRAADTLTRWVTQPDLP